MLESFLSRFPVTDGATVSFGESEGNVKALIEGVGGRSFSHGLYRVHTRSSAEMADAYVARAFPELAGSLSCFGYDWMGRQFATDGGRGSTTDPEVVLVEPGTAEALEIPVPFSRFHDSLLIERHEAALATSFFNEWVAGGGAHPALDQCIGYSRPLFLGGEDDLDNLEIQDLEVYWEIMGQLRTKIRGLA